MDEKEFLAWYKNASRILKIDQDPDNIFHQYNYREYYKKYVRGRERQSLKEMRDDKDFHFTDEFKLPGHPTFSNQSIYNDSSKGIIGGYWVNDTIFVPSKWNLENRIE